MFEKFVNAIGYKLVGRRDLLNQFRRYRRVIGWLYAGLFRFDKWKLSGAILNNALGMTLQGGALTLLMLYGSMMEEDRSIDALGMTLYARDQYVFLAVLVFIGMLLSLGGLMKFFGSKVALYLSLDFARDCSLRMLVLSASNPAIHPQYDERSFPSITLSRITGMVVVARAVRPLLNVSKSLTGFLYGLAVLLFLNPILTLGLLLMSIPALFGQYLVNYNVVQNETGLRESNKMSKKTLRQEIKRLSSRPSLGEAEIEAVSDIYENGSPRTYSNTFAFRKLAAPKSTLVSDISTAVIAIVMASVLGYAALEGSINWITFLAYMLFARLTFMSFRGILKSITGFARHYPRIRGIHDLVVSSVPRRRLPAPAAQTEIVLASRRANDVGDIRKQEVAAGSLTGIFCKTPVSRYNSSLYINALLVADSSISDFLLTSFQCLPDGYTRSASAVAEQFERLLELHGPECCTELLQDLGDGNPDSKRLQDAVEWPEFFASLDSDSLARMAAAAFVILSDGKTLFVDFSVFEPIADKWDDLQRWLKERPFVFICSTEISEEFVECAEWHMAISNSRAVAVMSAVWAKEHMRQLEEFVEVMEPEEGSEYDDDDDDDD